MCTCVLCVGGKDELRHLCGLKHKRQNSRLHWINYGTNKKGLPALSTYVLAMLSVCLQLEGWSGVILHKITHTNKLTKVNCQPGGGLVVQLFALSPRSKKVLD